MIGDRVLSADRVPDDGYIGTNEVWKVETSSGARVVKIMREWVDRDLNCFWLGLQTLFGARPAQEVVDQPRLSRALRRWGKLPVPAVIAAQGEFEGRRPIVVLDEMPGESVAWGSDTQHRFLSSQGFMHQLGEHLANLHNHRIAHFGNHARTHRSSLIEFPDRVAHTMAALVDHGWADDDEVVKALPTFQAAARSMPAPQAASLIMCDIGPSQYLIEGDRISALIDLEGYVIGPPELELAAVELWGEPSAPFVEGYRAHANGRMDLSACREAYRYFLYVLYQAPSDGLGEWLGRPSWFD